MAEPDPWDQILIKAGMYKPVEIAAELAGAEPANPLPDITDARTKAWAQGVLDIACERIATAPSGQRNHTLNSEVWSAYHKLAGKFSDQTLFEAFFAAAGRAGLLSDPDDGASSVTATIRSAMRGSIDKHGGRYQHTPASTPQVQIVSDLPGHANGNGEFVPPAEPEAPRRTFKLVWASEVEDKLPIWAWNYAGKGRIQLGTLALFAGRPGAGKSSAARWFAGLISRGELEGCWHGEPQIVMYISPAEESHEYIIKPGLRATGANLDRISFHKVLDEEGKPTQLLSALDEDAIVEQLLAVGCRVVVVDPVMSTISSAVDINRNNETRSYVEPWARIADRIDGIVVGVVHLKKATGGDVVGAITGSSAFGEVARSIFGFVKDPESDTGDRVMSQHKNSTGEEDLAVIYRIEPTEVCLDSGATASVGRFIWVGDSDQTAEDVLSGAGDGDMGSLGDARAWLSDYLEEQGTSRCKSILEASRHAGLKERTIHRAAKGLRVVRSYQGFPRESFWGLPKEVEELDFSEPTTPWEP